MTDSYPIVKLLILIAVLFYSGHQFFQKLVESSLNAMFFGIFNFFLHSGYMFSFKYL